MIVIKVKARLGDGTTKVLFYEDEDSKTLDEAILKTDHLADDFKSWKECRIAEGTVALGARGITPATFIAWQK